MSKRVAENRANRQQTGSILGNTLYAYTNICVHAVELLSGPSLPNVISYYLVHVFLRSSSLRSQNGLTKPPNRKNLTKYFSEQFEGITGSLPSKTRVLRQIAPESSP